MNKDFLSLAKHYAWLLIGIIIASPILFLPAVRYSFPLGYGGMFTQMAEQIVDADFALPMTIPHYGPGGIPFVYPPLAHYVFAIALKLGIPTWAYLRIIPAVLTLIALIPLYLLTEELLNSKIAGAVAIVLSIYSPDVYSIHVWSAGVVRGLALVVCAAGLLFYIRAMKESSWKNIGFSGVFFGLLLMTHWLYIVFAALFGIAYLLSAWTMPKIRSSLVVLAIAAATAVPWLGLIISRHGINSILVASSSHRNADFFLSANGHEALNFVLENLKYVTGNPFLALLSLAGLILLITRRQFHLPLAFGFVLLMGESSFYEIILGCMFAGAWSAQVFEKLSTKLSKTPFYALASATALVLFLAGWLGIEKISAEVPEIDGNSTVMAEFVRGAAPADATYLYIGKINEAEWFPYLLDRTPVFALWGSEWKGTYAMQLDTLIQLRACQLNKDWNCMDLLMKERYADPDLLIAPNQHWLELQIKDSHTWKLIYDNERYQVWEKLK